MRKRYFNETTELFDDTEETPAEVESNGPETKNGIITNSLFVNVRKEPNIESDSVEVLRRGDKVKLIKKVAGFYEVNTSVNKHVYISSDFIEEE